MSVKNIYSFLVYFSFIEKVVPMKFHRPALAFGNYHNTFIMKNSAYITGGCEKVKTEPLCTSFDD